MERRQKKSISHADYRMTPGVIRMRCRGSIELTVGDLSNMCRECENNVLSDDSSVRRFVWQVARPH